MEVSIPYSLIGPDGSRAVFGQGAAARSDPDWVGYLTPGSGISISRSLRSAVDEFADYAGGIAGDAYPGVATIAMSGILDPNATMATRQVLKAKLRAAARALRSDAQLRYTPSGQPERSWWLRQAADPDIAGGQPWTFALQFVSGRAYALSPDEMSQAIVPGSAAGEIGISSPLTSPMSSPIGTTGQQTITPGGVLDTWPRFRITGPITNPKIVNNTLGLQVAFIRTLAAGDVMDFYPELGRLLVNGADAYSALDRPNSRLWQLRAGLPNDVRLLATAYSAGASLTVYWRNAWED